MSVKTAYERGKEQAVRDVAVKLAKALNLNQFEVYEKIAGKVKAAEKAQGQ